MKALVNAKLVFPDQIVDGNILIENGIILASGDVVPPAEAELIDMGGAYVGPGLVDIHCHGFAKPGKECVCYHAAEDPAAMAREHLKAGTTSLTPSAAYSWSKEDFLKVIRKCKAAMEEGNTPIIGIHFEGPFTNPKYGAKSDGAWPFSREICDEIFDAAGDAVLHCTYAPELPHAPELEAYLKERGVAADIGHTELSPEDADRAVKNGAKIVTHLFDAMGCWRGNDTICETGVIQESADTVVLSTPGLFYELICDSHGVHVKPANVRMALRTAGEDRIILVTDCAEFIDYNPADYPPENKRSIPDLRFNELEELSGSCLVLSDACRNFMRFTGADVRMAFKCAATNPAKALGLDARVGTIYAGRDANLLVVDEDFHVKEVIFRGERV